MSRKESPELNADSMADIAFLLLIFFLVTTTAQVDSGIRRKITEKPKDNFVMYIKKKNILEVNISLKNQLFVTSEIVQFKDLKKLLLILLTMAVV
ncbi:MAG: biopolymer transport protein ExbD [Paraglaciecola sp.]|jgi:biopolymer transport protein ExbD|uniref:ExbD/TolR family protein n=1 Tax=Polaribacter sp. TaxID=1920175 RepID=UPI003AC2A17A